MLFQKDARIWDDLKIPIAMRDAAGVERCTFCNTPVNDETLTRGTVIRGFRPVVEEQLIDGAYQPVIKFIPVPSKVVACPDCVLQIRPIYSRCRFCKDSKDPACKHCRGTRDGDKVSNGIKFKETPG